jgi:hypothetical protein
MTQTAVEMLLALSSSLKQSHGIAGKWKASVVVKLKLASKKAIDVAISGSILY